MKEVVKPQLVKYSPDCFKFYSTDEGYKVALGEWRVVTQGNLARRVKVCNTPAAYRGTTYTNHGFVIYNNGTTWTIVNVLASIAQARIILQATYDLTEQSIKEATAKEAERIEKERLEKKTAIVTEIYAYYFSQSTTLYQSCVESTNKASSKHFREEQVIVPASYLAGLSKLDATTRAVIRHCSAGTHAILVAKQHLTSGDAPEYQITFMGTVGECVTWFEDWEKSVSTIGIVRVIPHVTLSAGVAVPIVARTKTSPIYSTNPPPVGQSDKLPFADMTQESVQAAVMQSLKNRVYNSFHIMGSLYPPAPVAPPAGYKSGFEKLAPKVGDTVNYLSVISGYSAAYTVTKVYTPSDPYTRLDLLYPGFPVSILNVPHYGNGNTWGTWMR